MTTQAVLLDDPDVMAMRRGQFITLRFDGREFCVGLRSAFPDVANGHNGHVARNGHRVSGHAPSRAARKKKRSKRGKSTDSATVAAALAKVRNGTEYEELRNVARDAGVSMARLRRWVVKSGRKWRPAYICRKCRPSQSFDSGVGYTGHVRIAHNGERPHAKK